MIPRLCDYVRDSAQVHDLRMCASTNFVIIDYKLLSDAS